MKRIFLTVLVALSTIFSYAQHAPKTLTLQPKVGINNASITDEDMGDPRTGLAVGGELEYQATDMVSVSTGLLYSMQGMKGEFAGIKETMKLDYINIPIMANVYVIKGLAVKLGLQPGFMVNNKMKAKQGSASVEVGVEDVLREAGINSSLNKLDLSIPIGVSYEYKNFVIDGRYNWGITKIIKEADGKNSVFQFTLGYKFEL